MAAHTLTFGRGADRRPQPRGSAAAPDAARRRRPSPSGGGLVEHRWAGSARAPAPLAEPRRHRGPTTLSAPTGDLRRRGCRSASVRARRGAPDPAVQRCPGFTDNGVGVRGCVASGPKHTPTSKPLNRRCHWTPVAGRSSHSLFGGLDAGAEFLELLRSGGVPDPREEFGLLVADVRVDQLLQLGDAGEQRRALGVPEAVDLLLDRGVGGARTARSCASSPSTSPASG